MGTFLIGEAWEYVHLFRAVKFDPNMIVTVGGVAVVSFARMFFPQYAQPVFAIVILLAMAVHLVAYERGRDQSAPDFGITVGGIVYIGWIGSYLLDLRNLPEGGWWFMLVMFCVWAGDSGAYSIGRAYGKHKMAPRLSPKKSDKAIGYHRVERSAPCIKSRDSTSRVLPSCAVRSLAPPAPRTAAKTSIDFGETSTLLNGHLGELGDLKPMVSSLFIENSGEILIYMSSVTLTCDQLTVSRWLGDVEMGAQVVEIVVPTELAVDVVAVEPGGAEVNYALGGRSSAYEKSAVGGHVTFTKSSRPCGWPARSSWGPSSRTTPTAPTA